MVDKVGVGCEHPVREPVIAHELPDVLGGGELRAFWRGHHQRGVVWNRRRRGPRPPSCPAPGDLVLLPDPGLVPEPDLYPVAIDPLVARDRVQALGERFLKASTAPAAWA